MPTPRPHRRLAIPLAATLLLLAAACGEDGSDRPTAPVVFDDATPRVVFDVSRLPLATTCNEVAPGTLLRWNAIAPGDSVSATAEVRVLVQRVGGADEPCFNDVDYEVERPIDPENRRWSDWIALDAEDGSGRSVAVPDLPAGLNILIAVQARDTDGRVDPDFDWYRNVLNLRLVEGR